MIGVMCSESERKIAEEFFELFKTPWEFVNSGGEYDVLLSTLSDIPLASAQVAIFYSSKPIRFDEEHGLLVEASASSEVVDKSYRACPIYTELSCVRGSGRGVLWASQVSESVAVEVSGSAVKAIRVGYDLFREVDFLLTQGQPVSNAMCPTLDIHIGYLRDWILNSGIPLVEIPPIPFGHRFFACLTHDIDFVGIRKHKLDRTMWGFLYRGLIGSVIRFFSGRIKFSDLYRNWIAALKLPFVLTGIAQDFWERFDKYTEIESGSSSTFFFIPFRGKPGKSMESAAAIERAAPYGIKDVQEKVGQLSRRGFEVGVHGIDAWNSVSLGSLELREVADLVGSSVSGIRMHWLYYDDHSPALLEQAGFEYDASLGYNDAVGFKNGTLQVFKPLTANQLLELPLAIQDTSMFYPRRMNLRPLAARQICGELMDFAEHFGGVLTLSWHDRSLEPERLWGEFYIGLLQELRIRNAWIGNARQVTGWFRARRSISFGKCDLTGENFEIGLISDNSPAASQIFVRIHIPDVLGQSLIEDAKYRTVDVPWSGEKILNIYAAERENS